jgi:uncharacterized metal-binding protein
VAIAQFIWGFSWNWQQITQQAIITISQEYLPEAIALVLGLELGAMSHSVSDWMGSAYKRSHRRKPRQKTPRRRK